MVMHQLECYAQGIKEIVHWVQLNSLHQEYRAELECFWKTHEAADEGTCPQEKCRWMLPLALDDLNPVPHVLDEWMPLLQGQEEKDLLEGIHRVSEKYPEGLDESTLVVREQNVVPRGSKKVTETLLALRSEPKTRQPESITTSMETSSDLIQPPKHGTLANSSAWSS